MDNSKVEVRKGRWEKGLFAKKPLKKGEVVATFEGKKFTAQKAAEKSYAAGDFCLRNSKKNI
ncbi:MAG TPA: hypothetical protein VJJ82_02335 [Candidatus Nanoarchaeia archaeon]|nr:hypothetical protein [Candidatus Nanoarchaeia archaeon]